MDWMMMFLPMKRYAEFSGRSRRKEYWLFFLLQLGLFYALWFLGMAVMNSSVVYVPSLLMLAFLVPGLACSIRRLHDTNRSAWYVLIGLIPFVGGLILLVFMLQSGTAGPNRFGPDPKAVRLPAAG